MRSQLVSRSWAALARVVVALCALVVIGLLPSTASAQGTPPTCLDPGTDQFSDPALDLTRWSGTLRHNASLYSLSDGKIKVQTGAGEVQSTDPSGGAPNIFLQPVPQGTWEVTTKVKIPHDTEGQQAGLLLTDPTGLNLVKLAYVKKGDAEQGRKWIEFLKIVNGVYDFSGTWHSPASNDYPDELWLRYRSDGRTLSGFYSTDGVTWESAGDSRTYDAITQPRVGFYALRGPASRPIVTAEFESFNVVPANDEFNGTELDRCRWEVLREDASGISLSGGKLTLKTLQGELSNTQSTVKNVLLQEANDSDWQATTKIEPTLSGAGQQGGIVVRGDDANHSKIVLVRKNDGTWIEFLRTTNGQTDFNGTWNTGIREFPATVHLRLASRDGQLSGYWSEDGETWTKVGDSRSIQGIESPQVGIMALAGTTPVEPLGEVKFDYFHVEPNAEPEVPPCEDPTAPETGFVNLWDGKTLNGWTQAGPGSFEIVNDGEEGCRLVSRGGLGLLYHSGKQYIDYSLRLQFKTADATDNSGVFVRFPNTGDVHNTAISQGYEVQIREGVAGDGEDQKTGSIYTFQRELARAANDPGEWNDYEIKVEGRPAKITAWLNGTKVQEWQSTSTTRGIGGYLGLQNHGGGDEVSFRNIRIQDLGGDPPPETIFDRVGITNIDNVQNSGLPQSYSLAAELMPPSGAVVAPDDDEFDDVPLRMPDTSGETMNMASMNGKVYTLPTADRKAYDRIHLFGTTTDGDGGGVYTLTFSDGTTETVTTNWPDWCCTGDETEDSHVAIGPMAYRHHTSGPETAPVPFHVFHTAFDIASSSKTLVSVQLPSDTTTGDGESFLMALTLQDGDAFLAAKLGGETGDTAAPVSTAALDPATPDGAAGWYTGTLTLTIAATDAESGVEGSEYRINQGDWTPADGPVQITREGSFTIAYRSTDVAGNVELARVIDVKRDSVNPSSTATLDPPTAPPAGGTVNVTLGATDATSGVEGTEYQVNGDGWRPYTGAFEVTGEGRHRVEYRSSDKAGNVEPVRMTTVAIGAGATDGTAPVTTATLDPDKPGAGEWYGEAVTLTLEATDETAVAGIQIKVDDGPWTDYADPIPFEAEGEHVVRYSATDTIGNVEPAGTLRFGVDMTAPAAAAVQFQPGAPGNGGRYGEPVTLAFSGGEDTGGSGAAGFQYRINGGTWKTVERQAAFSADGGYTIDYRAIDGAGNGGPEATVSFTVEKPGDPPAGGVLGQALRPAGQPPAETVGALESFRTPTLGKFLSEGLRLIWRCDQTAKGTISAAVSKARAKKLGLERRKLASGSFSCQEGRLTTLRLVPSAKTAKALRKALRAKRSKSVRMTVKVAAGGKVALSQSVTVKKAGR